MAKEEGVIFGADGSFWLFTFVGGGLQVAKPSTGEIYKRAPAASLTATIKSGENDLAPTFENLKKGNTIYIKSGGKDKLACVIVQVYLRAS
jgi:hypothetical protein